MLPVLPGSAAIGPLNRMDSWFDRFFDDRGMMAQGWTGAPMAMWEDENQIHVEAELPGFTAEDVDVTVQNRTLFLRGERKPETGRRYLVNARSYGQFEQVMTLPDEVNPDDIQAELKDGILRIDLAKSPEAKPKKIAINPS